MSSRSLWLALRNWIKRLIVFGGLMALVYLTGVALGYLVGSLS